MSGIKCRKASETVILLIWRRLKIQSGPRLRQPRKWPARMSKKLCCVYRAVFLIPNLYLLMLPYPVTRSVMSISSAPLIRPGCTRSRPKIVRSFTPFRSPTASMAIPALKIHEGCMVRNLASICTSLRHPLERSAI